MLFIIAEVSEVHNFVSCLISEVPLSTLHLFWYACTHSIFTLQRYQQTFVRLLCLCCHRSALL